MKKLIAIVLATGLIFTGLAWAEITYAPLSPDNTIQNRNRVKVTETNSRIMVDTRVLTIREINLYIQSINKQIQELQAARTEWQALKALVQTEADKVILYVPPPDPESDPPE